MSGRRRRHHLIAKTTDARVLCGLPKYRRRFVLASDIVSVDTCDACMLEHVKAMPRGTRSRGGSAGPMGGPGAGPVR